MGKWILYHLPQDKIEKEVLSDNSEVYTIVIQELAYNDSTGSVSTESEVVREHIIKVHIFKEVADILNGNCEINNNSNETNKEPSNNTHPTTGDLGTLGFVGLAGLSVAGIFTINRKKMK